MDKLGKYILIAIIITLIGFILWYFSSIVIYILISAVLSLMGKPLVDELIKVKIKNWVLPKWLAATITLSVMWAVVAILISFLTPLIYDKVKVITSQGIMGIDGFIDKPLADINAFLAQNSINTNLTTHGSVITNELYSKLSSFFDLTLTGVGSIIDSVVELFVALFSVSFITFFFLKEDRLFKSIVLNLFPRKFENGVDQAIDKSIALLSKYFIGLMLESFIKVVIITFGLYFIGIDFATSIIVALITGVLNVIPYIGPLIGAVVGILLSLTSDGITADQIYPLFWQMTILFSVFQLIDNIILQPYIYSSSVKAHPLEIFIVILLAGSMAGVMGMLLAIPAYTVLRVFAKTFFQDLSVVQKLTDKI
ncbi:MAG: AI-2E family transporter [Rikenellaceae bacterium]